MDWYPEPGETPLFRGRGYFASGRASKVARKRWFRDDQGQDIGNELPGWPSAPVYGRRGGKAVKTGRTLGVIGKVTAAVIVGAIETISPAGGSGTVDIAMPDGTRPTDRALEVDDFPVLWAPPGTIARTVPWQLDEGRRPKEFRTDLQLTDRRLLVLGNASEESASEALWQLPLDQVSGARYHPFSTSGGDISIIFADGSWIRLDLDTPGAAAKAVWVLSGNTQPVEPNQAQKAWITHRMAGQRGWLETIATPVPDAPPGTLSIEVIMRLDRDHWDNIGIFVLDADGRHIPRKR